MNLSPSEIAYERWRRQHALRTMRRIAQPDDVRVTRGEALAICAAALFLAAGVVAMVGL